MIWIRFGTCKIRRLNQLPNFCRIFDCISRIFDWLALNWNTSHLIDLDVAFYMHSYKMRRLNRALKVANQLAIYNYNFTSGLGVTALNPAPLITIQRWQYLLDSATSEFWVWRNNHLVTMPPLWTKSFVYCNSSLSFLRSLFFVRRPFVEPPELFMARIKSRNTSITLIPNCVFFLGVFENKNIKTPTGSHSNPEL